MLAGVFKTVFEDKLDQLSVEHPYVVERCVVLILRSAVLLVAHNDAVPTGAMPLSLREVTTASHGRGGSSPDSVWMSLRLMRGLSGEVIGNLSDRIGLGVLSLIR